MKLRALRSFAIGGGKDVAVGEVFDEPVNGQAWYWLGLGMVEKVEDEPPTPETVEAPTLQPAGRKKEK